MLLRTHAVDIVYRSRSNERSFARTVYDDQQGKDPSRISVAADELG